MVAFRKNRWLALVLCFVLLAKAAMPVGFMPDTDALRHGIYKLRICGGLSAGADHTGKQTHPESPAAPKQTHDNLCPFAGLHAAGLPVLVALLVLFVAWQIAGQRLEILPAPNYQRYKPQARGPPLLLI